MGPLITESNQTSSVMESENATTTNVDLNIHSPTSVNNVDPLIMPDKKLSPSSSSDSLSEDPFQEDDNEPDKSPSNATNQTTESPTTQVMEQAINSPYRIPSSVFSTTNTTSPMEWSTASNESLFSIHMGNMSFTKDQSLLRSGELGEPPSTSGHMFNYSANLSPGGQTSDSGKSSELDVAVETMQEVLRESAVDQSNVNSLAEGRISRHSVESGASAKSFAFPILAGDREKGRSAKIDKSTSVGPEMPQVQPQQQEPKARNSGQTKWFSCFSCCTFCS